jgi:uncharacterized protein (TIGR03435 family)
MRRYLLALAICAATATAQTFDEDVVRPHDPKVPCAGANLLPGGRFIATCWDLKIMIREAYDALPDQISGGPAWINTESWDITAKADGIAGEIPTEQFRSMLRGLIKGRFHLTLRIETKDLPGFALVVVRKGSKLKRNTGAAFGFDLEPGPVLTCKKVTMTQLASWLKSYTGAGRTVVDKTGLTGEYDFTLKWTPQPMRASNPETPPVLDSNGPAIFTALEEQLGVRLESQKVPTSIFVIEGVDRP